MAEETQQTETIETLTAEVATLRRVHADLLAKSNQRKTQIEELQASVATLTSKLTDAQAEVQRITIDAPMKALAEAISVDASFFTEVFNRTYKVESKDGALMVQGKDGKPIKGEDGKPISFEPSELSDYLSKSSEGKLYERILVGSRASGSGSGSGAARPQRANPAQVHSFGLR